jgi:sugar diacid utilization regulator
MVDHDRLSDWAAGIDSDDGLSAMLDMMSAITDRLGDLYEDHTSLEAAVIAIEEFTGWQAVIVDDVGRRVGGHETTRHPHPEVLCMIDAVRPVDIDGWLCLSIPATERHVLCVDAPGGLADHVRVMVLGEIVALTAFELRIQEAVLQERLRLWGDLAEEILAGADRRRVIAHAKALGHELERPHRVGLVADGRIGLSVEQVRCALRRANVDALAVPWEQNIAVVLDGTAEPDEILKALDHVVPGGRPWMGVSTVKPDGFDLTEALAEASVAVSFGRAARDSRTINYGDLGVFRLFSPDGRWTQLEDFVREMLGPLLDYDAAHSTDLVQTLDAYLRRDGSLNQLADDLLIHRSTLVYRLRRIRELLDVDIDDSQLRLDLSLAARAVDVLKVTSGEAA